MRFIPLLLALCLVSAPAAAQGASAPSRKAKAAPERTEARRRFDATLKAERLRFKEQQRAERTAFRAALAGKTREQRKAALAEFRAGQQERLKAFRVALRKKRDEFIRRQPAGRPPGD